ncbi:venom allergen 5-like [Andrena cerasifolii]|uniref:venom allergen 5-like n=1 Tax=Andrena cerasifolii TaxID=2819439 RepID=UPI004037FEFF
MTGHISFYLLLFLTGCCDCTLRGTISPALHLDGTRYCHICTDHTMCRFPFDMEGARCMNLEQDDLDEKDIETILDWHNIYRNVMPIGEEQRGNPGPQQPAKHMMEMIWDDELAHIARRWALQCNLVEKDQCRDVERFGVWQNVHVLDVNSVGNSTSTARIHFHIQSWYDEVEDFDSTEFGLLNFTARGNLAYIAFASTTISNVGCGRAIYTALPDESLWVLATAAANTMPFGFGDRVETLVCNYGPLDQKTPRELYEDGVSALCPQGTVRSPRYEALCQRYQDLVSQKVHRRSQVSRKEHSRQTITSGTYPIKRAVYLVQTVLLLLGCLST